MRQNARLNRLLAESNDRLLAEARAESVRIQDDLGRLLHFAEGERDSFATALLRLHMAIRALGQKHGSRTFFECKPTDSRECCDAWLELNDAQDHAAKILEIGGRAMAPEGLPRKLPGQADD